MQEIKKATELAEQNTAQGKLTTQTKSLLKQLTLEINRLLRDGEWDFAVRLAHYRHEFAKTHNSLEWYIPYLEIRKVRDQISISAGR